MITNKKKNSNNSNDNGHNGGANKKKNVSTKLKNILSQPIPQYWPEISENDATQLKDILSALKYQNNNLKDIGIIFGLNSSLCELKSKSISYILISTEIRPKFIASQLIYMILSNYRSYNIKLLCVPNLKELTMNAFGIRSLCISFYKNHQYLESIENWINKKCENFPIPEEIIQYYDRMEKQHNFIVKKKSIKLIEKEIVNEQINFNNLYLVRPIATDLNRSERAFIPENAKNLKSINFDVPLPSKLLPSSSLLSDSDYISFSEVPTVEESMSESDLEDQNLDTKSHNEENNEKKDVIFNYKMNDSDQKIENMIIPKKFEQSNKIQTNRIGKKRKINYELNSFFDNVEPKFKYFPLKVNKIRGNPNRKINKNVKK